jgi:spherulation-specific family 4 protein
LTLACYIPLYIYPNWYAGPTYNWTPLINAIVTNPTQQFVVVLNVNNGPDTALNTDYVHGITDLTDAASGNLKILGYTFTSYGARPIADIKTDINRWNTFYGPNIDGVLLDEMASITGSESYYTEITDYAKTTIGLSEVWGNPGNPTITSYLATVDTVIVFEGSTQPSLSILESATFYPNYPKTKFALNIFGQTVLDEAYIRDTDTYVGYIHYTDDNLPNPYDTFATYLDNLVLLLVAISEESSSVSYVQGVDFLSITAEVKELARSVVTADFSDAEIQRYQYMRYSQIRTFTDKDDWATTDREYGALQLIETKLAASDIMEHYGTAQDITQWQAMRESALMELTKLVDNMDTATEGAAGSIRQTEYKSWILNSNVSAPNRLHPNNTSGESFGSEVDF